uniref:uncharacterized protein LOC120336274 n=1 Tax=Styela clava TaxID=7725 RepID=UPI001939AE09|nr:uncharacterized protein LOC120336274 [Styela clava]
MDFVGVSQVTQQTTDKDELFVCPFDPIHRISAKRFVYHIIKCRKNHPHIETETCPFNARHIVLKPDIRHHTSICPDRKLVELELNSLDRLELSNDQLTVSSEPLNFGDDEDWDQEIARNIKSSEEFPTFDPFSSGHSQHIASFYKSSGQGSGVNKRREAIKQMKERMRQEAQMNVDQLVRRPYFDTSDQGNHPVFSKSVAHPSSLTNHNHARGDSSDIKLPPKLTKQKPRLAANFNMQPKFSNAIGRGRHLREMQNGTGEPRVGVQPPNRFNNTKEINHAFGRGRQFQSNMHSTSSHIESFTNKVTPSTPNSNGVEDSGSSAAEDTNWGNDELVKQERKLIKLLKQIDALEKKSALGEVLDSEQKAKMLQKQEILTSLKQIRNQLME